MKNGGRPVLGILEWLRPGEEQRVERLFFDLYDWLREERVAREEITITQ